jgi:hypothetical protein
MLLIISILLAFLPLLGIAWVLLTRSIFSVDGLFLCLILAAISGIFALNAFWEFQRVRRRRALGLTRSTVRLVPAVAGGAVVQGLVQRVDFYEAHVGQANKSVITIANGAGSPRILVLAGDLRNRVPAGKRVQLVYRDQGGVNTLVEADYS